MYKPLLSFMPIAASAVAIAIVGMISACKQNVDAGTQREGSSPPSAESRAPIVPSKPQMRDGRPTDPSRLGELPRRNVAKVDAKVTAIKLSNIGNTDLHTIGASTATFGPRDTVYAAVQSTGTASAYTLYAKWIAADGNVLSDYGLEVTESGPTRTVLSLSKPDGWLSGANRIEIAINGQAHQTIIFQVQ